MRRALGEIPNGRANLADTVLNQQVTNGYGDGFNRLTSRTVTSGTVQNYTYTYDRYGNRVTQTALQTGYNFNPTINPANNQITTSGFTYDAAGNMTNDTVHSYAYDAEGNITKVDGGSTAQYVYDVFNRRIHVQTASATTEYIYDYAGRRISSWLSPNNSGNEGRIYWDGQQIGYRSTDGTTYFDHQDTLGTERMRTNYAGSVGSSYISLPWGDGYTATVNSSGADQDNLHFASLERDAESGTEHAQFRNYASAQGRWLAPDSYLGSYDLTNPQSMNRYSYALNNPTSFLDPSGLDTTQPVPCLDQYGNSIYCMSTVNGNGGDGGDILCWWCTEYGGSPSPYPIAGRGPSAPPITATLSAPNNGPQHTSFRNCATQKLKPQLNANLNTWLGQLKRAPLVGVAGATAVTGAIVVAEPETLPIAPALFGVLAVNITVTAADISTTYAAAKSILQIGGAAITCGAQEF